MSLMAVGFWEGLNKLASTISLKPEFPTFLASCTRSRKQGEKKRKNRKKREKKYEWNVYYNLE